MNGPKPGKINTRTAMYFSFAVVGILLIVGIVFLILNNTTGGINGTNAETEITPTPTVAALLELTKTPKEEEKPVATPTEAPATPTEAPATHTATPTSTNTPTPTNTSTPLPTATNTPTPLPEFKSEVKGFDQVPEKAREAAEKYINETFDQVSIWSDGGKNPSLTVKAYSYPAFTSVLYTYTAEDMEGTYRETAFYDNETGEKLSVNQVFSETYLAIVKERLQTYAPKKDEIFTGSSFVSYVTPYKVSDYENFYIHDEKVTFVFNRFDLIEAGHKAFTYDCEMKEAKAFMKRDLDGNPVGYQIRTDLDPNKPMIAFTFDDGPWEPVETELIKMLEKYNAKATFFTVGDRVVGAKSWLRSIQAIAAAGHEVGSHSYNHDGNIFETKTRLWSEINKANKVIAEAIGYAPTLLRLPGGKDSYTYYTNLPMPMINWSIDSVDYGKAYHYYDAKMETEEFQKKVDDVYNRIMKKAGDGEIILMHSLYSSSQIAAERAMEELSKQGYQFVTVSELAYYKGVTLENGRVTVNFVKPANINRDYRTYKEETKK